MGVYFAGRTRSAEDQIWDHLDRMRNAGPVADYYLAAHERQAWAVGTGRAATAGTSMTAMIASTCRRWIGTRRITVARCLVGTSPVQSVDGDKFLTTQHRMAS
jgi:hypothetical protein